MTEFQGEIALLFSKGRALAQNPALPAEMTGSGEAHSPSSKQVFNAQGFQTVPGFSCQTATIQNGQEDPSTTHK